MTPDKRREHDKKIMDAVLKREREGWSRVSLLTIQYVHPSGFGFCTQIQGQWEWIAHPAGQDRKQGVRTLMESAMRDVENEVNQA
jgi:hypothetical protein